MTLTAGDTAEDLVLKNLARRLSRVAAALGSSDRLAAFLDDRRMAAIVIGQRHDDIAAGDADSGAGCVVRDEGDLTLARDVAARLQSIRRRPADLSSDVLVSSLRSRRGWLPPGLMTIVTCTARTADGFVAARRLVLLHEYGLRPRPSSASALRRAATAGQVADPRPLAPQIDRWFESVSREHEAAICRQIAREASLRDRRPVRSLLQPGLFDCRAVVSAERAAVTERSLEKTRAVRIAALERARGLQLVCEQSAVLLIWG